MKSIAIVFVAKIFSLIGAVINTVGFATFFIWESLVKYRWQMIIGGLAIIIVAEGVAYFLAKKMVNEDELIEEDEEI